jgi:flagellar hook assembly protein FlgD
LKNEEMKSGNYSISWDGYNENGMQVGSGIYLCRLICGNETLNKRLIKL